MTVFLIVCLRYDFIAFQKFLYRVCILIFGQVLESLFVLLVIVEGHADKPEMRRLFQLAPEILDEVFEDTRILVEFQE